MKYYTLAEHRTFCIESGIPNGEVWREVAKLGWLPKGIYHNPANAFDPKQKEYDKKRQSTPEAKAYQKERHSTPEHKAKRKEYESTPEYKARKKEWNKRRYRRNKK